MSSSSHFGRACNRELHASSPLQGQRRRDIYPLPYIDNIHSYYVPAPDGPGDELLLRFSNASIASKNDWYGYTPATIPSFAPTPIQRDCLRHWIQRTEQFLMLLADVPQRTWMKSEPAKLSSLTASRVDVLETCGRVETIHLLTPAISRIVLHGEAMFPRLGPSDAVIQKFRGSISEYASLIIRQLKAHRLRLRCSIKAGGSCFYITKPGKDMLRHLRNGNKLSASAAAAPPPRFLCNPSVFTHLRASDERPLYLSSRDCRSCFEQLALPEQLREYMAQQPIRCAHLVKRGISMMDLRQCFDDLPTPLSGTALMDMVAYPVACTWPQGFSWSPFIAQEKLIDIASSSGFDESRILAPNVPPPLKGFTRMKKSKQTMWSFSARSRSSSRLSRKR